MAKINIEYEFSSCKDCPYLNYGYSGGGCDGRGTRYQVPYCEKKVFGSYRSDYDSWSNEYKDKIPKVPPYGCPFIKTPALESLAQILDIDYDFLKEEMEKHGFTIPEDAKRKSAEELKYKDINDKPISKEAMKQVDDILSGIKGFDSFFR